MTATVLVLGTAQDGGFPHAGCQCVRCEAAREDRGLARGVAAIAVVGETGKTLLVDATPEMPLQLEALAALAERETLPPDGILLTHAHMGHYTGLSFLGREAMDAHQVPVYVTERMRRFLKDNRPWGHLITRDQIAIHRIHPEETFDFDGVKVTPFLSQHRAQDSDTIGLELEGASAKLLYLPDADRFPDDLVERIRAADVALVDGTFYSAEEVGHRDVEVIPHPFVEESVERLAGARGTVCFTHLNHTNPLLDPDPNKRPKLPEGFAVLEDAETFPL